MEYGEYRQGIVDDEQLKILSVAYWVSGGMTAFYSLYFLVYAVMGFAFLGDSSMSSTSAPPEWFGALFTAIGFGGFAVAAALGAAKILVGFWLRKRTHRVASMVVAAISCLEIPYGTVLGICTFIVLCRPSVRQLYGAPAAAGGFAPPAPPALPVPSAPPVAHAHEGGTSA